MSLIWLPFKFKVIFERLSALFKGDSKDSAPLSPIWLLFKFRVRFERVWILFKGYSNDYAPMLPC